MIGDMFGSLLEWILTFLGWMVTWFADSLEWVYQQVQLSWLWIKGIVLEMWLEVTPWILGQMPAGAQNAIDAVPWDQVAATWADVAWIIPLEESLAIIVTTFGIVAILRTIRWIIGLIPTVEG